MVNAVLHVICGNCGSRDFLSWDLMERYADTEETIKKLFPIIKCGNCATIHYLDNMMNQANKQKQ